jgi:hypothetical protein
MWRPLIARRQTKAEQFSVDARHTPELVIRTHLQDQRIWFHIDLRAPSPRARFPAPTTAKAGPMPTHQRFGTGDREDLQKRREPSVNLDQEPAIAFRDPEPTGILRRTTIN